VEAAIVSLLPHPDHQATTTPTPHPDLRLPGGGLVKRPGVPTEEVAERFKEARMASVPPSRSPYHLRGFCLAKILLARNTQKLCTESKNNQYPVDN